jgi:hypothetical protein
MSPVAEHGRLKEEGGRGTFLQEKNLYCELRIKPCQSQQPVLVPDV